MVTYGRTEDVPVEVFAGVIETNVMGSVHVARHVVPVLRRQESGTLVLVGSVIGHIAVPGMTPYAVSKVATEEYAIAFAYCYDMRTIAFRFFNVFGPLQPADHAYAAVIPAFVVA